MPAKDIFVNKSFLGSRSENDWVRFFISVHAAKLFETDGEKRAVHVFAPFRCGSGGHRSGACRGLGIEHDFEARFGFVLHLFVDRLPGGEAETPFGLYLAQFGDGLAEVFDGLTTGAMDGAEAGSRLGSRRGSRPGSLTRVSSWDSARSQRNWSQAALRA